MIYQPLSDSTLTEALYLSGVTLRVCGELTNPDWEDVLSYVTFRYERFIMEQAEHMEEVSRLLAALLAAIDEVNFKSFTGPRMFEIAAAYDKAREEARVYLEDHEAEL